MSGEFKQACVTLQRAVDVAPRASREPALARLARRLESLPLGGDLREPADIEEVANTIRSAIARGGEITSRQLRQGIWCLWNQNTRLVDDDTLRKRLFDLIAASDRPRAFRTLAANFLEAFGPEEVGIAPAGALLSSLAPKWEGNWQQLHHDYRIFDVVEGPKALARAVAAEDRPPDEILRDRDVSLMSARGGYVKAVIGSLLDHLANGGEPDHERRLDKVQKYALTPQGNLTFGDMVRQIAEAILLPFKGVRPSKGLLDRVLNLLTKALGDPRLPGGRWRQVPDLLTNMIKGWLAEQSLRQFLDVVGETTDNPTQWQYRRAFWEGVFQLGLISEAWVAFGTRGARLVKSRFGNEVSFGVVEQVKPRDKPVDAGHAVLFLRIGDSLVTDWSHMGRCNLWSDWTSPDAPRLYEKRYRSNAVQIPGTGNTVEKERLAVMHSNPEHYSWQRTVATRLQGLTGRQITEKHYALRR